MNQSAAALQSTILTERPVPQAIRELATRLAESQLSSENPVLGFSEIEIPSIIDVRDLVDDLREAIFPGLVGGDRLGPKDGIDSLARRLHHLQVRLARVITVAKTLRRAALGNAALESGARNDTATRESLDFLLSLPKVRTALVDDAWAALEGDPAATSLEEVVLTYPGHYAVSVYRLAHELWKLSVPYVPRMMAEFAHRTTGIDIHPAAKIGSRFFIDHGTGVVIGETTVIGDRVRLYQGVTLGAHSPHKQHGPDLRRADKRHPTLEDDVIVYAGATILGGATVVGKGAVIGGSSWVVESVPPGAEVKVDVEIQRSASPHEMA